MNKTDTQRLEGWVDLVSVGEQLGMARQVVAFHTFDVGAFPGLRRLGTQRPVWLVPDDELAAFTARQAEKGNRRANRDTYRPLHRDEVPPLPSWALAIDAARFLGITGNSFMSLLEYGRLATVRVVGAHKPQFVVRIEEVHALHAQRVRQWATRANIDQLNVEFAALDAAYRTANNRLVPH